MAHQGRQRAGVLLQTGGGTRAELVTACRRLATTSGGTRAKLVTASRRLATDGWRYTCRTCYSVQASCFRRVVVRAELVTAHRRLASDGWWHTCKTCFSEQASSYRRVAVHVQNLLQRAGVLLQTSGGTRAELVTASRLSDSSCSSFSQGLSLKFRHCTVICLEDAVFSSSCVS